MRVSPDGRHIPQVVVALTQRELIRPQNGTPRHVFRGGSTLVVDLTHSEVKYRIVKHINSASPGNALLPLSARPAPIRCAPSSLVWAAADRSLRSTRLPKRICEETALPAAVRGVSTTTR